MATGFIYTVASTNKYYEQAAFHNVPTEYKDRLYFGPCKIPMRPRMKPGDYVFGVSKKNNPRRIVFIGHIEDRITFKKAYGKYPELRARPGDPKNPTKGPIHVEPCSDRLDCLPYYSNYKHIEVKKSDGSIKKAMHPDPEWKHDLASPDLDAFFVCSSPTNSSVCVGRWLGKGGPEIESQIINFLKKCSVHGKAGCLRPTNDDATLQNPIRFKGLYAGLHLETDKPEMLIRLCEPRTKLGDRLRPDKAPDKGLSKIIKGSCSRPKKSKTC